MSTIQHAASPDELEWVPDVVDLGPRRSTQLGRELDEIYETPTTTSARPTSATSAG